MNQSIERDSTHGPQLFGQPRGLATLFLTEMWERFTYYGMRAILILFMAGADRGRRPRASTTRPPAPSTACTSPRPTCCRLLGGWIADRLIGQQRAVVWGGVLIMLGNGSLAAGDTQLFFVGLIVIVLGVGLLKPNISAHRRAALSGRRLAARCRLLDLLHGHQPRRVPRLDLSCRSSPQHSAGAQASRCRRSACCSAWCSSRSRKHHLGTSGVVPLGKPATWLADHRLHDRRRGDRGARAHRHARSSTRCASRSSRTGR